MTTTSKQITLAQIQATAQSIGVETNALRAVIQEECRGSGFDSTGQPVILFERHIFLQQLLKHGLKDIAAKAQKERPDLCNPVPGGYGTYRSQQQRLADACKYDRNSALEAASWGLGQVMGDNWSDLGFATLQDFINEAYKDEVSQLDLMIRFLKKHNLIRFLVAKDWTSFARGYNGAGFAKFAYDKHIAANYAKLNAAK